MGIKQNPLRLVSSRPIDSDLRPFAEEYFKERQQKDSNTHLTVEIILTAPGLRDLLIMKWERQQETLATKKAAMVAEEAAKRDVQIKAELAEAREELRQQLDITPEQVVAMDIEKWAARYVQSNLDDTEMPRIDDQEGNSFNCCLAHLVGCCDGKTPVTLFAVADYKIVADGAVLGICAKVAEIFGKQNETLKSKRLQCTNSLAKAKEIVNSRRQNHTIFDYVNGYADCKVNDLPLPRMNELGKHVCGLPVNCCNKQEEAQAWAQTADGELFGVCKKALDVFRKLWAMDKRNRLMFTHTVFAKAEEAAAKTKAHQQTFNRLVEYANQMAVWSLEENEYPQRIEKDGKLCCGVPGCPCGNKPVDERGGFGSFVNDGVVKGICAMAGAAFNTANNSAKVDHLKWTRDQKKAEWIMAQNWNSRNSGNSSNRPDPSEARKAREKKEAEDRLAREQEQQRLKELKATCKAKLLGIDPELDEAKVEKMASRVAIKYDGDFRTAAINKMVSANGQASDEQMAKRYARAAGMTDKELEIAINAYHQLHADEAKANAAAVAEEHNRKGFGEENPATTAARKKNKKGGDQKQKDRNK